MTRDELATALTGFGFAVVESNERGPTAWGKRVGGMGGADVVVRADMGRVDAYSAGTYNEYGYPDPDFDNVCDDMDGPDALFWALSAAANLAFAHAKMMS